MRTIIILAWSKLMNNIKHLVFSLVFLLGAVACSEDKPNTASSEGEPNAAKEAEPNAANEAKINEVKAKFNEEMDKISCADASSALEKNQSMVHIKTLLDKKCPAMYRAGWLKDDELAKIPMVEGCPETFRALQSKGMLLNAGAFIKKSCKQ